MRPRLTRLAGALMVLLALGIVLLMLVPSLVWFGPWPVASGAAASLRRGELSMAGQVGGWAVAMLPYLAVAFGLSQLMSFCRRVRDSRVFTGAAASALRRFGWSLIAASVLLPLTRLVLWLVIAGTAPGPESGLGGVILTMLVALGVIFGLVFVVFAAILREASRLAEENAGFI